MIIKMDDLYEELKNSLAGRNILVQFGSYYYKIENLEYSEELDVVQINVDTNRLTYGELNKLHEQPTK